MLVFFYYLGVVLCAILALFEFYQIRKTKKIARGFDGYWSPATRGDLIKRFLMNMIFALIPVFNIIYAVFKISILISESAWWKTKL